MKKLILVAFFIFSIGAQKQIKATDTCMSFTQYITMPSLFNNDTIHPPGSLLMTTGNIEIFKPFSSWANFPNLSYINVINGDTTVCYNGSLDISLASAPYPNKTLTFTVVGEDGIIVDGTTIFNNGNAPAVYNGNGYVFTSSASTYYTIKGNFNNVRVFGSTVCLSDICSGILTSSDTCMNFTPYNSSANLFNNDVLYPAGSQLMQTGDIKIIKPYISTGTPPSLTNINGITGDSMICLIGSLDINISTSPIVNKKLTFSTIAPFGMIVDGTTIFNNSIPPASFSGPTFNYSYSSSNYTISGNFNVVRILAGTNCIYNICLEELLSTSISDINNNSKEISVFPNPANDNIQIIINELNDNVNYQIFDVAGKTVMQGNIKENNTLLNIGSIETGMYFITFFNNSIHESLKFVKK